MNKYQDQTARQMFAALSVIANDQIIRSFLIENDPMALRQVENAIAAVTGQDRNDLSLAEINRFRD